MLGLILANWRWVVMGLLVAAIGVQTWRLDRCQTSFHDFRVAQEALGQAQRLENARIATQREKSTQEALDAKDKAITDLSRRYADARRLLNNPRPGAMPTLAQAAPSLSTCPDPDLAGKLAEIEGRILTVIEAGDAEIAKYRSLWQWSQGQ